MIQIGNGKNISKDEKNIISIELPELIEQIINGKVPPTISLPTGEKLKSASRITALKCHCILLARKAFGIRFHKHNSIFEKLAMDLLFYVMRHQFNYNEIKGEFCCPSCTLSLLPLYTTECFRWVNCIELKQNITTSLTNKTSMFCSNFPEEYSRWAIEIK